MQRAQGRHDARLRARTARAMHDACRRKASRRALAQQLHNHSRVTHGTQRIGSAIRHEIRLPASSPQRIRDIEEIGVAVLIPRDIVDHRAVEPIEQHVAGRFIARLSARNAPDITPR